jgi:hypothetical protein
VTRLHYERPLRVVNLNDAFIKGNFYAIGIGAHLDSLRSLRLIDGINSSDAVNEPGSKP